MKMTYGKLLHLSDAFAYFENMKTDEGRKENKINDELERCQKTGDEKKRVEEINKNMSKYKGEDMIKTKTKSLL